MIPFAQTAPEKIEAARKILEDLHMTVDLNNQLTNHLTIDFSAGTFVFCYILGVLTAPFLFKAFKNWIG